MNLLAFAVLFRSSLRRFTTYRASMLAGAFTNTVFGLVRAAILAAAVGGAAATSGGALAGYTRAQVITFAWLGQALLATVNLFQWNDLALRVRTGDIAIDLARPLDLQLAWLAQDLGRAAATIGPRGVPPLVAGALTTGLVLPTRPVPYLFGGLALVLAVALSFSARFLVNLSAFWLTEVRGVIGFYVAVSTTICGLTVPVDWFPGWLRTLARATPFPSMLQTPLDLFTARLSGLDAMAAIGVQAGWLLALLALGRVALARATRTLVVQGG